MNDLYAKLKYGIGTTQEAKGYIIKHGKKPVPELEFLFADDAEAALWYANTTRQRFVAGEPCIASTPSSAYGYARYIIRGKFPLGERAIASSPNFACAYADHVLRGRFLAGEKAISKSPYKNVYHETHVINAAVGSLTI